MILGANRFLMGLRNPLALGWMCQFGIPKNTIRPREWPPGEGKPLGELCFAGAGSETFYVGKDDHSDYETSSEAILLTLFDWGGLSSCKKPTDLLDGASHWRFLNVYEMKRPASLRLGHERRDNSCGTER